jgi:hypothetical protein
MVAEMQASLNRLAGTSGLDAQGAANAWAGTSGLDLIGALNAKAGTSGLGLNAVANRLAATSGLEAQRALDQFDGVNLDPLLAEAVVLLRASEFTGEDGDDWVNEGTGGSTFNAVADAAGTTDPHYVTSPEPGFEMGAVAAPPNYQVPDGAAVDPGSGSFTYVTRMRYLGPDGGTFEPIVAKITGTIGVDATGWGIFDGSALGPGVGVLVESGGAPVTAVTSTELVVDTEYLLVARLNRADDTLDFFVDGMEVATGDATAIGSITSTNPIIISRSNTAGQTHRDEAYWDRALTDTEITVDLPAALGV